MADHTTETGTPEIGSGTAPVAHPGADIVSLQDVSKDLRFPVVTTLEAYWQGLRGTRLVPARADVDPRQIEDALEYAFILERIAPGMGRFRLAGMHLNDLMGMEVRGMPMTAFFTPEARKMVSVALERVFADPAIVRLTLSGETGLGRPALDARLLLLPLKSDFGDVSRALGCLVTAGPLGRSPRRFAVRAEEIDPIAGEDVSADRRVTGWAQALERKARDTGRAAADDPSDPAPNRIPPQRATTPRPERA
ncbi:MAG: PAS domain-containing protein, partial [Pseudomonadota bacterium]